LLDFLDASAQRADNDRLLAEAMRRSSAAVVLGYFFHMSARELNYQMAPEDIERQLQQLQTSRYPVLALQGQAVQPPPFFHAYAPESNLPLFTDAAAGSGYFSLKSDPDGVIRWMLLMLQGGEDLYPPLAVVAAWHYLGKPSLAVHAGPYGVEGVQLGTQFLPTDHTGQFLINYLGPPRTFPHFSISDILHGAFAPGTFTNKIVLVGATATGTYDLRSTPLSPVYPGVEIHATVLDNILTQRFLTRPAWATLSELGAILVLGVCLGIALPRLGALQGLGCALLLGLAYLSLVHWLFVHLELWLNVVYPLLSLMSNYTVLTVYAYISVERQRKHIKGAFEHYVSPDVVNEIVRYPEKLNLGGERRVLTVLFSDIQNFTGISESMESPKLVELLNEYLTAMTNIVLHHRGTLDKYIGDAIMAFYGAPIALPHHPLLACYTALDMLAELDKLRMSWADRKLPQIRMRIGINTGDMIVGNMDSDKHFDYTVMGDTVNLASRLEGLNKAYGTSVLISETIADLVAEHCILREIDMAQVVGRKQPVRIYTLLGRVGTMHAAAQTQAYSAYAAGLAAYRQQDWDGAIQQFQHALSLWPDDTPSHTMLYRCHIYQQAPPPAEWDGVFEHLHK
ncbi:MAG: CHASE2 domain-containing protein, partial [Candidatus Tectomicrobia bacterium]|nr:CHASE2 domain-containing protein [Candidatus Tectomicrobia bacterium]